MRRVFTIGQSVFDILFKNNQPFTAKVGGSMLNTSISLGRLGLNVNFIGEYGNDFAGNITHDFLKENNVNTDYVFRFKNGQTTVSLAFLDEQNNASYNFYRNTPQKRPDINLPKAGINDIILFGSFYIFDKEVEEKILPFLINARKEGALLIYDPNFRKSHHTQIDKLKNKFLRYIDLADIVRGSDEDFEGIFGISDFKSLIDIFPNRNAMIIRTSAYKEVEVSCANEINRFDIPKINPVSTIGAGDTFNAGLIYGLIEKNINSGNILNIAPEHLKHIIEQSISFASHVCMSEENYLSDKFCKKINKR